MAQEDPHHFTLLSIFVAFLLFGLLMTIRTAFTLRRRHRRARSSGADSQGQPDHAAAGLVPGPAADDAGRGAGDAQHLVRRRLSGSVELLRADRRRSRAVHEALPGVQAAARSDEGVARPIGRAPSSAWISRSGSTGRSATAFRSRARSGSPSRAQVWEFNIVGIYDGDDGVDKTQFFFRYDYLDENRRQGEGAVGWYIVKIADAVAGAADGRHVRRDVRQLLGRDEDDDREGLRRGLRQAGGRHRRDHDRDSRARCSSR